MTFSYLSSSAAEGWDGASPVPAGNGFAILCKDPFPRHSEEAMSATAAAANPSRPADAAVNPTRPADSYQLFRRIVPPKLINQRQPSASQAVYTAFVTTWLLLYQRLQGGASLNDAVSTLLFSFPKEDLPRCKRIKDDTLSANNSAY